MSWRRRLTDVLAPAADSSQRDVAAADLRPGPRDRGPPPPPLESGGPAPALRGGHNPLTPKTPPPPSLLLPLPVSLLYTNTTPQLLVMLVVDVARLGIDTEDKRAAVAMGGALLAAGFGCIGLQYLFQVPRPPPPAPLLY